MINYTRIDHVHVTVPLGEEHNAQQFYANVLGFENMSRAKELSNSSGYWFKVAGVEFHIGVDDGSVKSRQHFALEISNIDEARRHLVMNNVPIIEQVPILGRQRLIFSDPYGNLIELLQFD